MIAQVTDHFIKAKKRLLGQFKKKPNIEGILQALCIQVQELEDVIFDMKDSRSLISGVGAQLDQWGVLLSRPRNGITDDESYRIVLLAKVAQNISQGSNEEMIAIFKLLMQPDYVHSHDTTAATLLMTAVQPNPIGSLSEIQAAVRSAKAGGVKLFLSQVSDTPFVFEGDTDLAGEGFGDDTNPSVGGYLAEIF